MLLHEYVEEILFHANYPEFMWLTIVNFSRISPQDRETTDQIRYLNINRDISALKAGRIGSDPKGDVLVVGSSSNVLCFDVDENTDIFFKEVNDSVTAIAIGKVDGTVGADGSIIVVGGSSAIQGYSAAGDECFWTVTGDAVSCLALCDVDGDGAAELLVGSEDDDIRVFRGESILTEISETATPLHLVAVRDTKFAYGLSNGTVGVYDKSIRLWRLKSKHKVGALHSFDLDGDGLPEVLIGWDNGRFEVRGETNGEVIFRDHASAAIVGCIDEDYQGAGRGQVLVVAANGNVRGYLPVSPDARGQASSESVMKELQQRKSDLKAELRLLQEAASTSKKGGSSSSSSSSAAASAQGGSGNEPADMNKLKVALTPKVPLKSVEVLAQVAGTGRLLSMVVFAEGLFDDGECSVAIWNADDLTSQTGPMSLTLQPTEDIPATLRVEALVSLPGVEKVQCLSLPLVWPKFAMFAPLTDFDFDNVAKMDGLGHVQMPLVQRASRVVTWCAERFLVRLPSSWTSESFNVAFASLRDEKPLVMMLSPQNGGSFTLYASSIHLAGEIIQDLCTSLGVSAQNSTAQFPKEEAAVRRALEEAGSLNAQRTRVSADIAESAQVLRGTTVRAEECRLRGDWDGVHRFLAASLDAHRDIFMEHSKRTTAHTTLMSLLKELNEIVAATGKLRFGENKTKTIAACRQAIKESNANALIQTMRLGA